MSEHATGAIVECYYCGDPIQGKGARRIEQGVRRPLHVECAMKWDNEAKRL